jgi:hypothetical protein
MSARSSDEFDYIDFARTIGGPPTTSTTHLDQKLVEGEPHSNDYINYSS